MNLATLLLGALLATARVGVNESGDQLSWGFNPPSLTVSVGDTVQFVNDGREPHSFTSQGSSTFDSGELAPGGTFSFTFSQAGTYPYVCFIHPQMQGVIRVTAGPASRFFPQTGYTVSDEGGVRFLSEFDRLGGVDAVGYPASRRFSWDGFTVQVFQRVVFQWRPEVGQAYFVNVFDRLHDLGKDDYLLAARQTPKPRAFGSVEERLAVMDAWPAIKKKFYGVVGDPIQANGYPTSDVVDMGNVFVLRCQRTVFQQWKTDVPWAKAGEVTVALGGDNAKEAGILPDPGALKPER